MSTLGLLERWETAHQVAVVPMGAVQFVSFQQTRAIGTRNLNSCSVVVIVSTHGAILAHIPPRPPNPSMNPYAGDENVRSMMGQVKTLYGHYKASGYFPQAETIVIRAGFQLEVALLDQMAIMQQSLQELGYTPSVHTYDVPVNRDVPGQGTVIVGSNGNEGRPVVYLQENPV